MPSVFGKENKKKQLILKLPVIFAKIQLEHHISPGDFPDCQKMQELLMAHDFTKFHSLKPKLLEALDEMLTHDIAKLMPLLRQEELESTEVGVQGGAFEGTHMGPFVERGPDEAMEDQGQVQIRRDLLQPGACRRQAERLQGQDLDGGDQAPQLSAGAHLEAQRCGPRRHAG
uniref:cDNA FLJ53713, highly similar to EH-domain-containing protein 2 n=1 Tax=Homo sapiens TaxID=9606 RepID=B4DE23_HUMAN|nr:unnamed protein product [Homo sapiens]